MMAPILAMAAGALMLALGLILTRHAEFERGRFEQDMSWRRAALVRVSRKVTR